MKFIVSSSVLLKHLQSIAGVLTSNNSLPILDNFLFNLKDKELVVSASDLETTMTTNIPLEKSDKKTLQVAIPAKLLLDTLKTFPEQPLTFTVDDSTFGIEISSDNGKYKLSGLNGTEYPKTPEVDSSSSISVEAGLLYNAVNKTIFATGNDDLRPVMSGVFFQLASDGLTFVATDAHKLVKYHRTDAKMKKTSTFIVPKKPLNLLKNTLANMEGNVKLEFNDSNAFFAFDSYTLICRLIEGKFPNYDAVIPKENPNKLTIDRVALMNSIKRVSIFSNKTTHQIRLKVIGSELSISAEDLDFANEAVERLTCQYEGEDMEIGFNSRFVIEMLNNLESANILLSMSAPNRAGIITPVEKDIEAESVLMLVMPVILNN